MTEKWEANKPRELSWGKLAKSTAALHMCMERLPLGCQTGPGLCCRSEWVERRTQTDCSMVTIPVVRFINDGGRAKTVSMHAAWMLQIAVGASGRLDTSYRERFRDVTTPCICLFACVALPKLCFRFLLVAFLSV